tara:strand:- start:1342 stop:1587 length:246 start_codon:yes stop_codon:yes gene_type:complete
MSDLKKREYYLTNKDKRLAYQKQYYVNNKERIKRRRELRREADPEWGKKQQDYNREYYRKNKMRIMAQRKEKAGGKPPLAD